MRKQIVLLSAKQGGGKTTTQRALLTRLLDKNFNVVMLNFADIIYEMHDKVIATLSQHWPDRGIVKDGPLLQLLGTEWGRNTIDKDIWVKCLRSKADQWFSQQTGDSVVIVGDCRFKNEFEFFPDALRVRLTCREEVRRLRCSMWRPNVSHPSEIDLDSTEYLNLFDLQLNTELTPVDGCVDLIVAKLMKCDWQGKRRSNF